MLQVSYRKTSLLLITLAINIVAYAAPKYTPENTMFAFDLDGVILTWGLQIFKKPIPGTIAIINKLHQKGYELSIATNNKHSDVRHYQKKFPKIFNLFKKIKHSFSGHKKPSLEFFQDYLNRYKTRSKRYIIFIDDRATNITAARKFADQGFVAIHFKNPEQLERALIEMKIL
ncbi:MAG TPA: HAD hydrolase-like protein [Candidatus Babeliales bacterium]|nr:HAD hydrolase-like protein [Candidatus Babeliales bacterium]